MFTLSLPPPTTHTVFSATCWTASWWLFPPTCGVCVVRLGLSALYSIYSIFIKWFYIFHVIVCSLEINHSFKNKRNLNNLNNWWDFVFIRGQYFYLFDPVLKKRYNITNFNKYFLEKLLITTQCAPWWSLRLIQYRGLINSLQVFTRMRLIIYLFI